MTRITRITETKRGRFALFSDEEFLFSIDGETYMATGLEAGCDLSDADLLALKDRSDTRKASDAALRYLSLRAYGEQELYQKLLGRFDEHSAAAAVAKMCELDLLDDGTFAREKAKGMATRGKSPREIRQKLEHLGIDRQLAALAVSELEIDAAGQDVHHPHQQGLHRVEPHKVALFFHKEDQENRDEPHVPKQQHAHIACHRDHIGSRIANAGCVRTVGFHWRLLCRGKMVISRC
ncbi:RecX family transcriptional regulator [Ruminococcaceae bacterium OttesenSCG-928-D13]|nr:RecX family transcriptional regulator [Ruminococcaceae bacterium OttesenSCG-928-D13]